MPCRSLPVFYTAEFAKQRFRVVTAVGFCGLLLDRIQDYEVSSASRET